MEMSDADFMLELKNDSETRKYAIISHEEIKIENHYKYLEKNIQFFRVIEIAEKKYGVIRIQNMEISIWIDKKFRGMGVAAAVLKHISKPRMKAKIVEGNISSMKAFVRSGFEPIEYINGYYIFQK